MLIYSITALAFLALGFYFIFNRTKAFTYFIFLCILLPINNFFAFFFYKNSIGVYEFFYLGVIISFLLHLFLYKKPIDKILLFYIIVLSLLITLIILSNESIIFILKDFKPFLLIFVLLIFLNLIKKDYFYINEKILKNILILNTLKCILIYFLGNYTNVLSNLTNDAFYSLNTDFRYIDIGTIFVIIYFVYKLVRNDKFSILDCVYIFLPIFLTQTRTIFFAIFFIFFIYTFLKQNIVNKIIFIGSVPILILTILKFTTGRLNTLLDINVISQHLLNRYLPFFTEMKKFNSISDYLFGLGIGHPFFIPWFEYRKNISNFNASLDSLYLTYYIKFGLVTVIIFIFIYFLMLNSNSNKTLVKFVFLYFLIMSFTAAVTYQMHFIFIFFFLIYLDKQSQSYLYQKV